MYSLTIVTETHSGSFYAISFLVPEDFHEVLQRYTMHGFRVIGLAWRPLESRLTWPQAQRIAR